MNDRFKFRMYDTNVNKMYMPNDFEEVESIYECIKQQINWDLDVDYDIKFNHLEDGRFFMQCTGLKDKNGKLIYEGDILQSEEYPFKNEKGYNYAAEVLWDDASATFYYYTFRISNNVAGRSTGNTGELNEYEDWKVIGNIYENKELMESEG